MLAHLPAIAQNPLDFGDAAAPYPTLLANDGARHLLTGPSLGNVRDSEADGQPSAMADGDDLANTDDEEGVVLSPALFCNGTSLTVIASSVGMLDAWIDFNRDGDWQDAGEQIFTSMALVAGANVLFFTVPCPVVAGTSFARFRISSSGGLMPTGLAADGEVEDYIVTLPGVTPDNLDFGDADAPYPTLLANDGARHALTGPSLGNVRDSEADGQPSAMADGDDLANTDDEEGVVLSPALFCNGTSLTVIASSVGMLDAWIDFNRDGDWQDAGEQIFTSMALVAGANVLFFIVPCPVVAGTSFARFRISSSGGLMPTGLAADGEVEDYIVTLPGVEPDILDFGDADAPYPTLLANDGARHVLTGPTLGNVRDSEADGQPSAMADGDDLANTDDEEGVVLGAVLVCGANNTTVNASATAMLDAWIDFNSDGDWQDAGEQVFISQALAAGANNLSFNIVCPVVAGTSFARFRISSSGGLAPTGLAVDGEVEDYLIMLEGEQADLFISKTDGVTEAFPGGNLIYTIVAGNNGPAAVSNAQVQDNFPAELSCTWTSIAAGGATGNTNSNTPANLNDLLNLPAGGFVTYTINCAIDINASGTISNTATITSIMDSASATDDDTILLELVEVPTLNDWGRWWLFVGLLLISVLTIRRRQKV